VSDPIALVRRGSEEVVAYGCPWCGVVASSPLSDGIAAADIARRHCATGRCARCRGPIAPRTEGLCPSCAETVDWRERAEAYARAVKLRPCDYQGPVFDPTEVLGDGGALGSVAEALAAIEALPAAARPCFLWAASRDRPRLDARLLIEALEADGYDVQGTHGLDVLQSALDDWLEAQDLSRIEPDERTAIVVDWAASDEYLQALQRALGREPAAPAAGEEG
jgi:hypothetical protein